MKTELLILFVFWCCPLAFSQWSSDPATNTKITDTTGVQFFSKSSLNPSSGTTYVSWLSNFGGYYNIYMNMIDKDGYLQWGDEGIMISDHPTFAMVSDYGLISDDDGCAVLVIQDARTGTSNAFAYRIGPYGDFLWGYDGIQLTNDTLFNLSPNVIQDHQGDYIFCWNEYYAGKKDNKLVEGCYVEFTKIRKDGTSTWDNPVIYTNDSIWFFFESFNLVMKEDNGFFLITEGIVNTGKYRTGKNSYMNLFIQSFDQEGSVLWDQPIALGPDNFIGPGFHFMGDAWIFDNGVMIVWNSLTSLGNGTVKFQYIDQDGNKHAGEWGTEVTDDQTRIKQDQVSTIDPQNGFVYTYWEDLVYDQMEQEFYPAILGQGFNTDGTRLWGDSGKIFRPRIFTPDTSTMPAEVAIHPDGSSMVLFEDEYYTLTPDTVKTKTIKAFCVNPDGDYVWDQKTIIVSAAVSIKEYYTLGDYNNGQWICTWTDSRDDTVRQITNEDIFAQNIIENGTLGPLHIYNPETTSKPELTVFPNPCRDQAVFSYSVPYISHVSLYIYNSNGQKVNIVINDSQFAGEYQIDFNTSGLARGIYYYQMVTEYDMISGKLIVH